MKKITRILSVALVAVMVLSMSAVSLADTASVYIPQKLAKLVGDVWLEDYIFPTYTVTVSDLDTVKNKKSEKLYKDKDGNKYYLGKNDEPTKGMYAVKSITEDSVMQFQFDIAPDWFNCSASSLDGGWQTIDIDETGYGELEIGEFHRQPGSWYAQGKGWTWTGGDDGFYAGKDFGDYSVSCSYHRDGSVYSVSITPAEAEDVFRTGQEGAKVTYTFDLVNVRTDCLEKDYYNSDEYKDYLADVAVYNAEKRQYDADKKAFDEEHKAWVDGGSVGEEPKFDKKAPTKPVKPAIGDGVDVWYISQVAAEYPAGNYIAAVEVNYRNDKKQTPYDYKISYATSENEIYKITYAASTSTVLENNKTRNEFGEYYTTYVPLTGCGIYRASGAQVDADGNKTGNYYIHTSADQAIYGEYFRNGTKVAISGSGDKFNKWYAPGHGKQVKNVKKSTSSFKSPRVF